MKEKRVKKKDLPIKCLFSQNISMSLNGTQITHIERIITDFYALNLKNISKKSNLPYFFFTK